MSDQGNRRRIQNFLIEPGIQIRYGMYISLFGVLLVLLLALTFYSTLQEDIMFLVQLTDVPQQAYLLINDRLMETFYFGIALILVFGAICFMVGIYITHRFVGPIVAFRRHVQMLKQEDFNYKTHLRPKDDFRDLAEELNSLSDFLKKKMGE